MRDLVLRSSIDLDASAESLWPQLTDTERINRTLGLGEVRFRPIAEAKRHSPARYLAETRMGGLRVTYDEEPFEFVAPRRYSVHRVMHNGALRSLTMQLCLDPLDPGDRTRAKFILTLAPRSALFFPFVYLNGKTLLEAMVVDAKEAAKRSHGERTPALPKPQIDVSHLARALDDLATEGVDAELVAKLGDLVKTAHDAEVVALRPFELARRWGHDERQLLRVMLIAVKTGLFELRWALVCPSCRTFSERVTALEQIPSEGHCQLCDIGFELEMDRAVEATFMVHPGVRRVNETTFCIGGPARTPHVIAQMNVAPSAIAEFTTPDSEGRYRIFARGGASLSVTIDKAASPMPEVAASARDKTFEPPTMTVAPSTRIVVTNAMDAARHIKLERFDYASNAATAAVIATMPEFRRIFSADILKRGTPLKVARVAMFFSDLTGSTALYSKIGDAAAFRIVDDHFDVLRDVVAQHDGALVKTMGDAVMASFHDTRACAAAAVEALRRFESFRADLEHGEAIGLKVGMYSGPCYVVTANGVLDYFGQTVNVTARVQHLAASGELVLAVRDFDSLSEDARADLFLVERFQALVKGVEAPLDLLRVRVAPRDALNPPSEPSIRALPSLPPPAG